MIAVREPPRTRSPSLAMPKIAAITKAHRPTASTIWPHLVYRKKSTLHLPVPAARHRPAPAARHACLTRGSGGRTACCRAPAQASVRPGVLDTVEHALGVRAVDPVDHAGPEGPGADLGRHHVRAVEAGDRV